MARKQISASDSVGVRMTREKETFKLEAIVNVDGSDTKCYAKCVTNFERQTYKVQPIITLVHDWNDDVRDAFEALIQRGVQECKDRLARFREETGVGTQGDLFEQGSAAEAG